ncbi:MerR family transcriptional regulator [Maricaulis maris]|jgi:DNA-binding transcriptional MerR regulator|uniref:MerR family transcriptional regulator n=1 Tax=Maricaulis maris TaxID=74318 RepID=UPI0029237AE3|nr:transcriptional regulator [Maricaulis maris]
MIKPVAPDAEFTIRELAHEFDITPRTLRFYEQKGMINPLRRGASRVYTAEDRARVELILRGKRVGFALDEIKEILDLQAIDRGGRERLGPAIKRFEHRITVLQQQREDVERALAELTAGLDWMRERLEDRTPPDDVRRRARAFEALAAAHLEDWSGLSPG